MKREEYLSYLRDYNKLYRKSKRKVSIAPYMLVGSKHLKVEPTENNFKGSDLDNPRCCKKFGCGNHLTHEQQLYSDYCIHHQVKQKIEPSRYVKYHIKKSA